MPTKLKKNKLTRKKPSWRDYPDTQLPRLNAYPSPESLHPNESTMIRAIAGHEEARAIISAWSLVVPVKIVEVLP